MFLICAAYLFDLSPFLLITQRSLDENTNNYVIFSVLLCKTTGEISVSVTSHITFCQASQVHCRCIIETNAA
jgi:hypothetical protein